MSVYFSDREKFDNPPRQNTENGNNDVPLPGKNIFPLSFFNGNGNFSCSGVGVHEKIHFKLMFRRHFCGNPSRKNNGGGNIMP
jgi:hypothetical protein